MDASAGIADEESIRAREVHGFGSRVECERCSARLAVKIPEAECAVLAPAERTRTVAEQQSAVHRFAVAFERPTARAALQVPDLQRAVHAPAERTGAVRE